MNDTKTINELIIPRLKSGEELVGSFNATKMPSMQERIKRSFAMGAIAVITLLVTESFWWMLIGLACCWAMLNALLGSRYLRRYCLVVTNRGIHTASKSSPIPYFGVSSSYRFYTFDDIKEIKFHDRYLTSKLEVHLKNDNNVSFVVDKYSGMNEKIKQYLLSH